MKPKTFELTYTHNGIVRKAILKGIDYNQAEKDFVKELETKYHIEDYKRIKIIQIEDCKSL